VKFSRAIRLQGACRRVIRRFEGWPASKVCKREE